jgi:hypothetical protein
VLELQPFRSEPRLEKRLRKLHVTLDGGGRETAL